MPLEILQLLSLTIRGNYYVTGDTRLGENYYPNDPCFSGCKEVTFQQTSGVGGDLATLVYPPAWFETLKTSGAKSLRFAHYQPPFYESEAPGSRPRSARMTAGFVGGTGTNSIEVTYLDGVEFWIPNWTSMKSDTDETTCWYVFYEHTLGRKPLHTHEDVDIALEKEELEKLLTSLITFCKTDTALAYWQSRFEHARTMLACTDFSSDDTLSALFPKNHAVPLELKQLLSSAMESFVFGAMGSWNDITPGDSVREKEYERLSDELYERIWSCLDAVNLMFHPQELPTPTPSLP